MYQMSYTHGYRDEVKARAGELLLLGYKSQRIAEMLAVEFEDERDHPSVRTIWRWWSDIRESAPAEIVDAQIRIARRTADKLETALDTMEDDALTPIQLAVMYGISSDKLNSTLARLDRRREGESARDLMLAVVQATSQLAAQHGLSKAGAYQLVEAEREETPPAP